MGNTNIKLVLKYLVCVYPYKKLQTHRKQIVGFSRFTQDSEKIQCFWHRIWNLRKIWRLIGLFAVQITHCWWSWSSKTDFGEKQDFAVHFEQNAVQNKWTPPRKNSYSKVPPIFWNRVFFDFWNTKDESHPSQQQHTWNFDCMALTQWIRSSR